MKPEFSKSAIAFAAAILASSTVLHAGIVSLHGTADGDSAYYEYNSDAFFQIDLREPAPNEHLQRFHAISNPAITFGNPAFDGFPNDDDFRLGHVVFDDAGLMGGTGTAPITDVVLGIGADPDDASHINYARFTDITTTVDTFSGSVELIGGQPVAINLTSAISVTAFGGAVSASGVFSITGDQFAGSATGDAGFPPVEWDFSGALNTVPEPATFALLGAAGVALLRRRRNR
ncbi:MAG TPA: PEP-CTERM sorting domain-containing protein [Phycisphaerae bacterium]|nr:PEP-CTERM sorting domain-containing protein [Phycisphaerae bacterium]HRW51399.1 PEP-CTERM sorting domain-containing protein [Phycisphaerae bacterium]